MAWHGRPLSCTELYCTAPMLSLGTERAVLSFLWIGSCFGSLIVWSFDSPWHSSNQKPMLSILTVNHSWRLLLGINPQECVLQVACYLSLITYTVWQVIIVGANFLGTSKKALKINFRDFKFRDSNQSRGVVLLHKRWCNRYTRSRSHSPSSLLLSHT